MTRAQVNIALLALCQALLLTNNVVNISMNSIVGYMLADNKAWATLPITAYTVGTALSTYGASMWMKRVGRRAGFVTGSAIGMLGVATSATGLIESSFWLLTLGTFVSGGYNAFGQYYRFAAAESVDENWRPKAIAYVLAGGIGGAIIGPEGVRLAKDAIITPFLGGYVMLAACALAALVIQLGLRIPNVQTHDHTDPNARPRPLREIAAHPRFLVAVTGAVVGYAMMSFLMTSTPLAMAGCGLPFSSSAFVIEWHTVGMFAPSFITGTLVKRFGPLAMMGCGAVLMLITAATALSGTTVTHFWIALTVVGLGWNLLYVGGTTLLTTTYRPSECARIQGLNDVTIFSVTGLASLMSGVLLNWVGWHGVVIVMLVPVLAALGVILWAARMRPAPAIA